MEPGTNWEDRTALVTGAARRIGRSLALALAGRGAGVVVHYGRSADEAAELVAEIEAAGGRAWALDADLADPGQAERLVARAAEAVGAAPDILINNASIFEQGGPLDTTVETWDRHQEVNIKAPFILSREFARRLPDGRRGAIVNLNDYRASRPGADHFAYTISKVGLQGLTRSLALALAPAVRVNELALGAVLPPEGASEGYIHTLRDEIPTRRFPSQYEVISAMMFLIENESVTGETIHVDGGRHLT